MDKCKFDISKECPTGMDCFNCGDYEKNAAHGLIAEKEKKAQMYLRVFSGEEGAEVFMDILNECLYFSRELEGPEQAAIHNVGAQIAENAGIVVGENIRNLTRAMLNSSVENKRSVK